MHDLWNPVILPPLSSTTYFFFISFSISHIPALSFPQQYPHFCLSVCFFSCPSVIHASFNLTLEFLFCALKMSAPYLCSYLPSKPVHCKNVSLLCIFVLFSGTKTFTFTFFFYNKQFWCLHLMVNVKYGS